uniref:Uncharacterized protein n=1 Tax=Mus musculus TaxID=10090 RepID=Q3TZ70_MOUSE|nr:unnamed protein product [Mus musculus]
MLQFLVSGASEDRASRSPRSPGVPGRRCTALQLGLVALGFARAVFLWPPPKSLGLCLGLFICSPSSSENFGVSVI